MKVFTRPSSCQFSDWISVILTYDSVDANDSCCKTRQGSTMLTKAVPAGSLTPSHGILAARDEYHQARNGG